MYFINFVTFLDPKIGDILASFTYAEAATRSPVDVLNIVEMRM